jgi:hypothetical protein
VPLLQRNKNGSQSSLGMTTPSRTKEGSKIG